MKKISKYISFLIFSIVLFSGCSNIEKEPEEVIQEPVIEEEPENKEMILNINWGLNPKKIDPQLAVDRVTTQIVNATHEGLFRFNSDGILDLGLAKDYKISEDGLKYTFYLREASWSDGTKIIANDFYYSWMRAINPKSKNRNASKFYCIKNALLYNMCKIEDVQEVGIEVIDEKTLEVTLEKNIPYFLTLLASTEFMPIKDNIVETSNTEYGTNKETILYSGPFIISEWLPNDKLILAKNNKYWDKDCVKLDKIEGVMVTDLYQIENLFKNDKLDLRGLGSKSLNKYKGTLGFKSITDNVSVFLQFNCTNEYLSNVKIRKALSMSIDRKEYIKQIVKGLGTEALGFVPNDILGRKCVSIQDLVVYDVDKALELFKEGLLEIDKSKEEFEEEVTIVASESEHVLNKVKYLQKEWKDNLDIDIKIEQVSLKKILEKYKKDEYAISYSGFKGDYNDTLAFLEFFKNDNYQNYTNWNNEQYDLIIDESVSLNEELRSVKMIEAEELLAEQIPVFPIYFPNKNYVIKENIKNINMYSLSPFIDFKWAYKE